MIPENVLTAVKTAFDAFYQARSQEVDRDIRIAENQLAYDGLGNSTDVPNRFREIYQSALRDCLSRLLTFFERTLEAYDIRPKSGLSQPMVEVIYASLQPIASEFNQRLTRAANNAGIPLDKNLDEEVARLQSEARVEVDLLVGRLKQKAGGGETKPDEDNNPLIMQPNFFGLGVDLPKLFKWLKKTFWKTKKT